VFSIFEDLGISVDVVATSEVSISLTLDPSKLWSRELIQQASVWHLLFVMICFFTVCVLVFIFQQDILFMSTLAFDLIC
jgi:hypothetical protein